MAEVRAIELDARLAGAYADFLRRAPQIARAELARGVEEALLLLEREVKEETPVGVGGAGGLRGSWTHALSGQALAAGGGILGRVFTPLNYALPVELGARPHFPPIAPIADWVVAKLGVPRSEARSVAFLVARKIAAKGTQGAHMARTALDENASKVMGILERARDRILARLQRGEG